MTNYFKAKLVKMGKWAMLPVDAENWQAEYTAKYFNKFFGFGKGLLSIITLDDGFAHEYIPKSFLKKIYRYIDKLKGGEQQALEKKIGLFYKKRRTIMYAIRALGRKKHAHMSDSALAEHFYRLRDLIHQITIFDQFGWLAEEYWTPIMEKILVKKLGLVKGSSEYNAVLFALIKPAEISTTLMEKRAVLSSAVKAMSQKSALRKEAEKLAAKWGWMPVFVFGEPWNWRHYRDELQTLLKRPARELQIDLHKLKKYKKIRSREIKEIVAKYKISSQDIQVFLDYGLVLDARNEAEYVLSYGNYFLTPIYKEIARRLALSIRQTRTLYEKEIVAALKNKADPHKILDARKKICGWGFDKQMMRRVDFSEREARQIYNHVEKKVIHAQGHDENRGVTGSSGKTRGIARILHSPKDSHRVRNGDILITHATTVDYLPGMKRAAAFVTEVGGLTCHAAVVAREFGVPCVVGLKNAMLNFRDGDIVEVDANKGVVRKI